MTRFPHHTSGDHSFTLITRYEDVRSAARDWHRYTSATPFRVPIPEESDVRPVRQYPIETDPPDHGGYRSLIAHRFSRSAAERIRPAVERLVDETFDRAAGVPLRVVDRLALPVVTASIAHTMGRPGDAALFESWGLHVFVDPDDGSRRRNAELDDYLSERVDAALAEPTDDLFGDLAADTIGDRSLTRDELLGYGYLVLAGGRDTVINAIVGATWFLATHPDERRRLADDPAAVPAAVEEFLRYFSPLAFIGRTVAEDHEIDGETFDSGRLVALGFAAANHDPDVFESPDRIDITRAPNRHMAFGHGPHTCIGAPLARMQLGVVVAALAKVRELAVIAPTNWHPSTTRAVSTVGELPSDLTVSVGR